MVEPDLVGGLQEGLADLASALSGRGWDVDLAITPEALRLPEHGRRRGHIDGLSGSRWRMLPRLHWLPTNARMLLQHVLLDGGVARLQSDLLHALERRLRDGGYDAVIASVSREAPGLARFVTRAHPNVLILSLNGLASELRLGRWLGLARAVGRIATAGTLHRDMYRGVEPGRIRSAVFASRTWHEEALDAGLPRSAGRTIYFGLPRLPPLGDLRPSRNRLLWVGRLGREKGLHAFIEAVALLRRTRPVTLTAVCGQGPADYRRSLARRIEELGLADSVELRPAVRRGDLTPIYQAHDALLFQSVFAEPVALVLLEAFAAGLPVVAPQRPRGPGLIRDGETCVCYASNTPAAIAAAVERMLHDEPLRAEVRQRAHQLVRDEFSLDTMGAAYDEALRSVLGARRHARSARPAGNQVAASTG